MLYRFRDKAMYWSKIAIFPYPPAIDAPLWGILSKYRQSQYFVWKNKDGWTTKMPKSLRIRLAVSLQDMNMTYIHHTDRDERDRHPDTRTDTAPW